MQPRERPLELAPAIRVSVTSATRSMPSRSRLDVAPHRARPACRRPRPAGSGSSRPTAPKSISPSVPSWNTKMLPGCGSAWKKPMPEHLVERRAQQLLGERRAGRSPTASSSTVSATVKPSKRSCTRSRRVQSSRVDLRAPAPSTSVRGAAPSRVIASASRRKSSSARRLVANCASISPDRSP